ncbi:MAG: hypothetical protein ACRCUS_01735 [Anaerovoracaceae bacterium]
MQKYLWVVQVMLIIGIGIWLLTTPGPHSGKTVGLIILGLVAIFIKIAKRKIRFDRIEKVTLMEVDKDGDICSEVGRILKDIEFIKGIIPQKLSPTFDDFTISKYAICIYRYKKRKMLLFCDKENINKFQIGRYLWQFELSDEKANRVHMLIKETVNNNCDKQT